MEPALQHIVERVRAAAASATPLRIRGSGSKDFYGQTLAGELLDMTPLAGVTSYEPSELVVTARAGTPLAALEAELADQGQCLPFEPPHFGAGATVGGMVAAGLNGPARAAVGAVRDYMLGVTILGGRGELLSFGGQVMKNVAGYDVSRLMAGSLGTLGVITEVSLKVLPVAPLQATLRFSLNEAAALQQLNRWAAQPLPVNASCWQLDAGQPCLWVRLRGAVAAVEAACSSMGGERLDPATAAAGWAALREQALTFFARQGDECLWHLSVPDSAPPLGLGECLIEWGGAQRWLKAPAAQANRLRAAAAAVGGHATLFIADSEQPERAEAVFSPLKPPLDRIHRALKQQFDPAGIFNRGRMFAEF